MVTNTHIAYKLLQSPKTTIIIQDEYLARKDSGIALR